MKVLVVGFLPFYRYTHNSCVYVVEELGSKYGFTTYLIPVSLKYIRSELRKTIETTKPDIVVGIGMDTRARRVRIELAAANVASFPVPDIDGYKPLLEEIYPGAPRVLEFDIPVKLVCKECITRRRLPIEVGLAIGTYLCNALAYTLAMLSKDLGFRAAFLHIPPSTDTAMKLGLQIEYSLPLNDIVECIKCVVDVLNMA